MIANNSAMLDLPITGGKGIRMLLHGHGFWAYINLNYKDSCVHIPNITENLGYQFDKIKQVAKSSQDLRASVEMG